MQINQTILQSYREVEQDPIVQFGPKLTTCSTSSSGSSALPLRYPGIRFIYLHPFHVWMGPGRQGKSNIIREMQGLEEVD